MTKPKKPDGYVIYHPDFGNAEFIGGEQSIEANLIAIDRAISRTGIQSGWQPKHVYFSDTPPTEPGVYLSPTTPKTVNINGIEYAVVSKEFLGWIEKFKTYIECVQRDRTLLEFFDDEPRNTTEEEYLLDILETILPKEIKGE